MAFPAWRRQFSAPSCIVLTGDNSMQLVVQCEPYALSAVEMPVVMIGQGVAGPDGTKYNI